jgi:hypothetical protein
MAGPLAPEVEAPDAAVGAPHVMEPDELDPESDAELAEDSAEVTNGSSTGGGDGDAAAAAAARRAERRRQQRAKRKHGRR